MNKKLLESMNTVAFIIIVSISMIFTNMFFFQLSNIVFQKVLLCALATSFELIKLYLIIRSRDKNLKKKWHFIMAISFSILSAIASLGFLLGVQETMDKSVEQISSEDLNDEMNDKLLAEYEYDIERYKTKLNDIDAMRSKEVEKYQDYGTDWFKWEDKLNIRMDELDKDEEETEEKLESIKNKRDELVKSIIITESTKSTTQKTTEISSSTFDKVASYFRLSGSFFYSILMFFIIVAIEICSYITAPDSTDKNETFKQSNLSKYIDGLFMGISSKNRLRTDEYINKITDIDIKQCGKYRDLLKNTMYRSKYLIEGVRGGTKANFNKTIIKTVILNNQG